MAIDSVYQSTLAIEIIYLFSTPILFLLLCQSLLSDDSDPIGVFSCVSEAIFLIVNASLLFIAWPNFTPGIAILLPSPCVRINFIWNCFRP